MPGAAALREGHSILQGLGKMKQITSLVSLSPTCPQARLGPKLGGHPEHLSNVSLTPDPALKPPPTAVAEKGLGGKEALDEAKGDGHRLYYTVLCIV